MFTLLHVSYHLSYMCAPLPLGVKRRRRRYGVLVPGGELTKVGHGYSPAPFVPPETPCIRTLVGFP